MLLVAAILHRRYGGVEDVLLWQVSGSARRAGSEEGGDEGDGQTDDIEVAAFDAGNPTGGAALDGVGAGLVHGLAGGDVGVDLFVREGEELDGGDFGGDFGGGCGDQGDAGENAMGASGEQAEHPGGVGGAFWLAEDVVVESDGGVHAQDSERF